MNKLKTERQAEEKRNIVFVAVVTAFITTFMGSALNLAIPSIEREFQSSGAAVGWIITIYMLTCAALAVPFGKLADGMERKKILIIGIGIFTLASCGGVAAGSLGMLLFFRFLQGVGASMIFSTNIAILTGTVKTGERGKLLGWVTSATYVGLSAGPVMGGVLNYNLGWRSVFVATAAISAVAFFCAFRKLPARRMDSGFTSKISFDGVGCCLFVFCITAFMTGLSLVTSGVVGWVLLIVGAAGLVLFIRRQKETENPVLRLAAFKENTAYLCANLAAMINYGSNFILSYFISLYLQIIMGYSSQTAGFLLILSPLVQAILSPVMGRLSDRYSAQKLSAAGMLVTAGVLLYFRILSRDTPLWMALCGLVAAGAGCAMFASPNTNRVMGLVRSEELGVASSILSTMRSLGHTASMALVTVVVSIYLGTGSLTGAEPGQLLAAMRTTFFLFGGLCILGIFIALKRKV